MIRYRDGDSPITDVMGYANEHELLLNKQGCKWVIIEDVYKELGSTESISNLNEKISVVSAEISSKESSFMVVAEKLANSAVQVKPTQYF